MKIIDQELGGTTPLDVIVTLSEENSTVHLSASTQEDIEKEKTPLKMNLIVYQTKTNTGLQMKRSHSSKVSMII